MAAIARPALHEGTRPRGVFTRDDVHGDTVLDCDVVMLQEVDAGVSRSNGDRQVELLGDELGLRYRTWFPNVDVRGGASTATRSCRAIR